MDIEKLTELKEKGLLTQKEFNEAKKKLLSDKDEKVDNNESFSWLALIVTLLVAIVIALGIVILMTYLMNGDLKQFEAILKNAETLYEKIPNTMFFYKMVKWLIIGAITLSAYKKLSLKDKIKNINYKSLANNGMDLSKKLWIWFNRQTPKTKMVIVGVIGLSWIFLANTNASDVVLNRKNGIPKKVYDTCINKIINSAKWRYEIVSNNLLEDYTEGYAKYHKCKPNFKVYWGNGITFYNGFGGGSNPTYYCFVKKDGEIEIATTDSLNEIMGTGFIKGDNQCERMLNVFSMLKNFGY